MHKTQISNIRDVMKRPKIFIKRNLHQSFTKLLSNATNSINTMHYMNPKLSSRLSSFIEDILTIDICRKIYSITLIKSLFYGST